MFSTEKMNGQRVGEVHMVPTPPPPPPPLRVAKAGRNNLNEEITPLLLTRTSDSAKPYQI
jgi:hypothetical protein